MQASALSSTTDQVLWAAFFVSLAFGAIARRTHFCTMGAISDVVNFGDWTRMRQWSLAAGVAMIGFSSMALAGWIDPAKAIYASNRLHCLSAIVGGLMFGFGMVLGSGCGSKTLIRLGGGNLKSAVVFLVMAIAAFATLKGVTAVLRVATVERVGIDFSQGTTLSVWASAAVGSSSVESGFVLSVLLGGALIAWAMLAPGFRHPDNVLAGLGVGGAVVAMWWVSGNLGYVPEHPDTLQEAFLATNSGRMESLSFVAPMAYALDWVILYSDKSKILSLGVVSVLGVVSGSALLALWSRRFQWEGFAGTEDLANHLVGGALMGVGGITAMGCSIGQGLSALSTLSAASLLAIASIILGAVVALRYQNWRLERMA